MTKSSLKPLICLFRVKCKGIQSITKSDKVAIQKMVMDCNNEIEFISDTLYHKLTKGYTALYYIETIKAKWREQGGRLELDRKAYNLIKSTAKKKEAHHDSKLAE